MPNHKNTQRDFVFFQRRVCFLDGDGFFCLEKPTTTKKIGKKTTKVVKTHNKDASKSSVGYVKERKVLARRLRKKLLG